MDTTATLLDGLNDQQRAAALATEGPVLILAGAGSGKTRALTHRIAHLMAKGIAPWNILAVTFTNKAAKEMKERIGGMMREQSAQGGQWDEKQLPMMGTFHSICVRILRRDIEHIGRDRNFVIYDADDQERLMKQLLKDMRIDEAELKPRAALGAIGRLKSEAISPSDAQKDAHTPHGQRIVHIYTRYTKALADAEALDFDDLILLTVRLFRECPDVLEHYQRTWLYLHVDEYQDTNHAQYLLITQLASAHKNLCVVGDPDQSIYRFRGADIRNILQFKKEYPDALTIALDRNYRSTKPILDAANAVIAANPDRPPKNMWTERQEGPQVMVQETSDERSEAMAIVRAVERHRLTGMKLNEQAILYRTHAQSRVFEEACMRAGIPYRVLGGLTFYKRKEVKDVLGYLQIIVNPSDAVNLSRIINVPSRKIGETTMLAVSAFAEREGCTLWDGLRRIGEVENVGPGARQRIAEFVHVMGMFREQSTRDVVSVLTLALIKTIKMEAWLNDGTEEGEQRWGNVLELLTVMHKYDQLDPETSLRSFLEEVALVSEVDKLTTESDALTLMTLHLCKGLEFEHVLIPGCEEGIFPHSMSAIDREQLAEERRLMYVGMTRAKTHLHLLHAQSRSLWGDSKRNPPSRFLKDLPEHCTQRHTEDIFSRFSQSGEGTPHLTFGQSQTKPRTRLEPFKQVDVAIEFNQDIVAEDTSQDGENPMDTGSRVEHPKFGRGTVLSRRGDLADIRFDSGIQKTLALSIAPLRRIG